jgi:hypothetical protein
MKLTFIGGISPWFALFSFCAEWANSTAKTRFLLIVDCSRLPQMREDWRWDGIGFVSCFQRLCSSNSHLSCISFTYSSIFVHVNGDVTIRRRFTLVSRCLFISWTRSPVIVRTWRSIRAGTPRPTSFTLTKHKKTIDRRRRRSETINQLYLLTVFDSPRVYERRRLWRAPIHVITNNNSVYFCSPMAINRNILIDLKRALSHREVQR